MGLTTRELTPDMWPEVEALFGSKGACGGCWCQAWHLEKGERWEDVKGAPAKVRMKRGVKGGTLLGILAFDGETPVGWCAFGPRLSFARLDRARTLKCDDADRVWSLPCFFVLKGYRGKGVAGAMLAHALKAMAARGARIAEGYPAKPDAQGMYIAAFAWTGTRSLFAQAGFTVAGNAGGSKQRVRKALRG